MTALEQIRLLEHLGSILGLACGGACTAKASAKHVCWMIVALVAVAKTDRSRLTDVLKELPKS